MKTAPLILFTLMVCLLAGCAATSGTQTAGAPASIQSSTVPPVSGYVDVGGQARIK